MTKERPGAVQFLAIMAFLAAVIAIFHTLQMLHILPFLGPFGSYAFFSFSLIGAILWGIIALVWLWVASKTWALDRQAWMFLVVWSILGLVMDFLSIIGGTPWEALVPSIMINGLVLILSLLPVTKAAFDAG